MMTTLECVSVITGPCSQLGIGYPEQNMAVENMLELNGYRNEDSFSSVDLGRCLGG